MGDRDDKPARAGACIRAGHSPVDIVGAVHSVLDTAARILIKDDLRDEVVPVAPVGIHRPGLGESACAFQPDIVGIVVEVDAVERSAAVRLRAFAASLIEVQAQGIIPRSARTQGKHAPAIDVGVNGSVVTTCIKAIL